MKPAHLREYLGLGDNQTGGRMRSISQLHIMALAGITNTVRQLLASGADAKARDPQGYTPLHAAVGGNHIEVVRLLLAHGADVNAQGPHGETPIDLTQGNPALADLLRRHRDQSSKTSWLGAFTTLLGCFFNQNKDGSWDQIGDSLPIKSLNRLVYKELSRHQGPALYRFEPMSHKNLETVGL